MMRNSGHVVVEFDAFEADHHEDAFYALLATLLDEIEDGSQSGGMWVDRLRQAAIGVGRATPTILAQGLLPGPLGAVLAEVIKHVMEQSGKSPGVATDQFLRERLDIVEGERKAINAFREELSALTPAGARPKSNRQTARVHHR